MMVSGFIFFQGGENTDLCGLGYSLTEDFNLSKKRKKGNSEFKV
jgi:hypothetical protein